MGVGPLRKKSQIAVEPEYYGCVRFFPCVTPVDTSYRLSAKKPSRDSWQSRSRAPKVEGGNKNESNVSDKSDDARLLEEIKIIHPAVPASCQAVFPI